MFSDGFHVLHCLRVRPPVPRPISSPGSQWWQASPLGKPVRSLAIACCARRGDPAAGLAAGRPGPEHGLPSAAPLVSGPLWSELGASKAGGPRRRPSFRPGEPAGPRAEGRPSALDFKKDHTRFSSTGYAPSHSRSTLSATLTSSGLPIRLQVRAKPATRLYLCEGTPSTCHRRLPSCSEAAGRRSLSLGPNGCNSPAE